MHHDHKVTTRPPITLELGSLPRPTEPAAPRERLWPAMGWWVHVLAAIGLMAVVAAAFANSYRAGMTLDNKYIIEEYYKTILLMNPSFDIEGPEQVKLFFQNDYWWPKGISGLYRPLTTFSYWIDYVLLTGKAPKVDRKGQPIRGPDGKPIPEATWRNMSWVQYVSMPGQLNTQSYHTINLIIHAINAFLVYLLALCLVKRFWPALFIAALFAAHPVTTESVTNIIGRADMFAAAAVFGGLLLYIRSTRSPGAWAVPWLIGLLLLTAFGVFSKESSAAVVLVAIVYDVAYRWRSDNPQMRGIWPLIGHGLLYLGLAIVLLGIPFAVGQVAGKYGVAATLPKAPKIAIAVAACMLGFTQYFVLSRGPRPLRIASIIGALIAISLGAIVLPGYPLIFAGIIVAYELGRGTLTSSNPRYRITGHATLYLLTFLALIALPVGALILFPRVGLPAWLRHMAGVAILTIGLVAHFLTVGRPLMIRVPAFISAVLLSVAAAFFTLWAGILLAIVVMVHELIAGSFLPRKNEEYRRDWSMLWNGFAAGYAAMLPPLIAMFAVRRWVFANATPAEEPFIDNPIRGIWQVANLNIPSFAEQLALKPMVGMTFFECKMTAIKVMGKLMWLLTWPQTLSSDYSYAQIPNFHWRFSNGFEDVKAIVALVAMLIIFVLIPVLAYRRSKPLFFFILFFFAAALPTSNFLITIGSIMAERFMYLPLAGFTGAVVIALYALANKVFDLLGLNDPDDFNWAGTAVGLLLPLVVAVYAIRSYARNPVWESDHTLWLDAYETSPMSFRSHQSLAFAEYEIYVEEMAKARNQEESLALQKQLIPMIDRMIHIDETALPIVDPLPNHLNSSRLYLHLGMFYYLRAESEMKPVPQGKQLTDESIRWLQKTAAILERGSEVDRSFNEVNRARAIARGDAPDKISDAGLSAIYGVLGTVYSHLGDYDKAVRRLTYMRHLEPQSPEGDAYSKIAGVHLQFGRLEDAAIMTLQALIVAPHREQLWRNINAIYSAMGPQGQGALIAQEQGVRLNVDGNPLVREHLMRAYRDLIRGFRRAKREDLAQDMRKRAIDMHGYPAAAFDPLFNEPVETVTPDGVQFTFSTGQ